MGSERAKVELFTDGSCFTNGAGGWAFRLITVKDGKRIIRDGQGEIVGGATTSQRAEMVAILAGLHALKVRCEVNIFTDCKALIDTWDKLEYWRNTGREIVDGDLWVLIEYQQKRHVLHWNHVKAHQRHNQNPNNASCDRRAKSMAIRVKERMKKNEKK